MKTLQEKCANLIKYVFEHYRPYLIADENDELNLIDPVDGMVIGFHYGETHMGVAFIISGYELQSDVLVNSGVKIIKGFINHSNVYQKEIAYHWDFNNFALCVLFEFLEKRGVQLELRNKLKEFIINNKDSNNATINWKPMRIYVNKCRLKWTNDLKYKKVIDNLTSKISKAQYEDGFFEDLLPKGTSFNFQYHIFTTSVIGFLKIRDTEIANLDAAITKAIDIMDYQGDINYLGRGNNQIFAWGPAIYLYSILPEKQYLEKALDYVYERSLIAIDNDNLIVNDLPGSAKNWWWDYHYSSVYIAHYTFWMALAMVEERKIDFKRVESKIVDSGVHIHKGNYNVVTFDGRNHYLAEKGKIVANITDKNGVCYFKGAFGPFYKDYGYKYSIPALSLLNYIGLLKQGNTFMSFYQKPIFPVDISVIEKSGKLVITFKYSKCYKHTTVNLPWFTKEKLPGVFDRTGKLIGLTHTATFKGPYGELLLYQSKEVFTDCIIIKMGE